MKRYTKKDEDGRYYIESINGKVESNIFGHTYGEAIDRFAELENADVVAVVRCCDCKYCETVIHSIIDEPKWFCTRMVKAFDVDPTCFCSYGERKE